MKNVNVNDRKMQAEIIQNLYRTKKFDYNKICAFIVNS